MGWKSHCDRERIGLVCGCFRWWRTQKLAQNWQTFGDSLSSYLDNPGECTGSTSVEQGLEFGEELLAAGVKKNCDLGR